MVRFNMGNQRILGHVLLFMSKVKHQIEMQKLSTPVDKSSALVVKQANNFSNGRNELILQPVFLSAKLNFRYPPLPLGRHMYPEHCTPHRLLEYAIGRPE
jgi:hypothetical protein